MTTPTTELTPHQQEFLERASIRPTLAQARAAANRRGLKGQPMHEALCDGLPVYAVPAEGGNHYVIMRDFTCAGAPCISCRNPRPGIIITGPALLPTPAKPRPISARYPGICAVTGERYAVGAKIVRTPDLNWALASALA